MIAKRIRKGGLQPRGSPKKVATSIVALTGYVRDADVSALIRAEDIATLTGYALDQALEELGASVGEKVLTAGSRNLKGDSLATWQAQMIATALRCPSSRNPIEHIVFSWQRDEHPTDQQIEEAVEDIVEVLGCAKNQVVWGAHQNTENIHVHLVINRVDPATGTMTQLGDGWDKDRLAQARAVIEARQGWRAEKNAEYVADAAGEVRRIKNNAVVRTADGRQHHKKGERAAKELLWREIPENAAKANAMRRARSWPEVHAELEKLGAILAVKGSGAVVITTEGEEKASRYHRDCSLPALVSRLGDFIPVRHDEPSFWRANKSELDTIDRELREDRAAKLRLLDEQDRERRSEALMRASSDAKRLAVANAVSEQLRSTKSALKAYYQRELQRVADARVNEDEWDNGIRREMPVVELPSLLFPKRPFIDDDQQNPVPQYDTRKVGSSVEYTRRSATTPAFIDHRTVIIVMSRSDDDVLAALKIGQERWGTVSVFGDKAFEDQCLRIARANGIPAQRREHPVRRLDLTEPTATPPVEAPAKTSTYPKIFTTRGTSPLMIAAVRHAGFEVGITGHVRFDHETGSYKAYDQDLDPTRRAQLERLVAQYTTQAAADKRLAEHWNDADARRDAEANTTELVANLERISTASRLTAKSDGPVTHPNFQPWDGPGRNSTLRGVPTAVPLRPVGPVTSQSTAAKPKTESATGHRRPLASTPTTKAEQRRSVQSKLGDNAMLAIVGRLYHDIDWSPMEYGIVDRSIQQSRTLPAKGPVLTDQPTAVQPDNRRALPRSASIRPSQQAAIAAASSRGIT